MTEITCNHCGYTWDYTGISIYAQCPRCQRSNSLRGSETESEGQNADL